MQPGLAPWMLLLLRCQMKPCCLQRPAPCGPMAVLYRLRNMQLLGCLAADVNQGFMLGDSRADTQQESPCSSQAGTPSAAAADGNNNPFRRSRLSRKTSSLTAPAAEALECSEELQRSTLPSVPSEAGPEPGDGFSAPCGMWPAAPPETEANSLQLPAAHQRQHLSSSGEGVVQTSREPSSQRRSSSSTEGLEVQGAEAAGQAPSLSSGLGLSCPSTLSLAAWQHRSSNSREAGSTRPPSRAGVPRSGSIATESVLSSARASFQLWRAEAAASVVVPVARVPSRLGPRPVLTGMEQQQQAGSPTALPPGSPPLGRGLAERGSSFSTLAGLQVEGSRLSTPKTSPGRGGSPLPAELLVRLGGKEEGDPACSFRHLNGGPPLWLPEPSSMPVAQCVLALKLTRDFVTFIDKRHLAPAAAGQP